MIDVENAARELLDSRADAPPVHGFERQRLEDQQIERASEDVRLVGGHGNLGEQTRELLLGYRRMSVDLLSDFYRTYVRPVETQQKHKTLTGLQFGVSWSDTSHRAEAAQSVFSLDCSSTGRRCNNP